MKNKCVLVTALYYLWTID